MNAPILSAKQVKNVTVALEALKARGNPFAAGLLVTLSKGQNTNERRLLILGAATAARDLLVTVNAAADPNADIESIKSQIARGGHGENGRPPA